MKRQTILRMRKEILCRELRKELLMKKSICLFVITLLLFTMLIGCKSTVCLAHCYNDSSDTKNYKLINIDSGLSIESPTSLKGIPMESFSDAQDAVEERCKGKNVSAAEKLSMLEDYMITDNSKAAEYGILKRGEYILISTAGTSSKDMSKINNYQDLAANSNSGINVSTVGTIFGKETIDGITKIICDSKYSNETAGDYVGYTVVLQKADKTTVIMFVGCKDDAQSLYVAKSSKLTDNYKLP